MEHAHADKSLTIDVNEKPDDTSMPTEPVSIGVGIESAKAFAERVTESFKREIPKRFAIEKWDPLVVLIVAGLVLTWVVTFGYYRRHPGVLGRPLQVGIVSWPGFAGGLLANNGLYRNKDSEFWKNGNLLVDFKVIDDNDELIRQFELGGDNGGIDVMCMTVDSLAYQLPTLAMKGIHPRAFMQVDWSRGGDAIVVGQNVKRIADLKGLKVARSTSASQWLLERSLEDDDGLTEEEKLAIIKDVNRSPEAREDFQSGKADAAVLSEPDVYDLVENERAKRKDAHVLVDTSAKMASNLIADVMVARQEFLQDSNGRLAIKAFINGWFRGTNRVKKNPDLAVNVLKKEARFSNRGDEQIRIILGRLSLSTLEDNMRMFGLTADSGNFHGLFNEASRLWLKRRYINKQFAATEACDLGLLKEIQREQGVPEAPLECEPIITISLPVDFLGQLTLSEEIRRKLDAQEVQDLFNTYPHASFCVQATADSGKDPKVLIDTSRARASAIIDYLARRYDRRRSEFTSDFTFPELGTDAKSSGYIRISVINRESESP